MANYPSHSILLDSTRELESGEVDDFSQAGIQHSRTFHSQQYYRFRLVHSLTLAEFESLLTTYSATPRGWYTLTYHSVSPQVTYQVKFLQPPQPVENLGDGRLRVDVDLRGYRD